MEEPSGDFWRVFLSEFETTRPFFTGFDSLNRGKKSVVMDLKRKQGIANLKFLLKDADVFITNVTTFESDTAKRFKHPARARVCQREL